MNTHTRTRISRVKTFSSREAIIDLKDASPALEFWVNVFRKKKNSHLISSCHIMFLFPNEFIQIDISLHLT